MYIHSALVVSHLLIMGGCARCRFGWDWHFKYAEFGRPGVCGHRRLQHHGTRAQWGPINKPRRRGLGPGPHSGRTSPAARGAPSAAALRASRQGQLRHCPCPCLGQLANQSQMPHTWLCTVSLDSDTVVPNPIRKQFLYLNMLLQHVLSTCSFPAFAYQHC